MVRDEHDDKHLEEHLPNKDFKSMKKKKSIHPEMGDHPLYCAATKSEK